MEKKELIVSLTSYPPRIKTVHMVIASLLRQTLKADRVILWLTEDEFTRKEAQLPSELLQLTSQGLQISWCKNLRSYQKLIPALEKYPEAIIVTADDDIIYDENWLSLLYEAYKKDKKNIHCHRVTKFILDSKGFHTIAGGHDFYQVPSYRNKLTGVAGTLYPPHCFYRDILRDDIFLDIAPTSDDIWFWAMAVLAGRRIHVVDGHQHILNYVPGSQECALWMTNDRWINGERPFNRHVENVFNKYPLFRRRLINEWRKDIFVDCLRRPGTALKNIIKKLPPFRQLSAYLDSLASDMAKVSNTANQQSAFLNKKIGELARHSEAQLAAERKRYDEKIAAEHKRYDEKIAAERKRYDEKIVAERKRYDEKIAEERKRYDERFRLRDAKITESYRNARYLIYKYLPAEKREEAITDYWKSIKTEPLNFGSPKTYNEKIQWLKLYGTTPLMTKLADKYEVRQWIREKIGERYLIPLLGVWDSVGKIDFKALPEKFVLKATHGSAWNIIVRDRTSFDEEKAKRQLAKWLSRNFAFEGVFEMQYENIKPRIIAEQYLENGSGNLNDYKFWCFDGKVHFVQYITDRSTTPKMLFLDRNWNPLPFVYSFPLYDRQVPRPAQLDTMIDLAEKLSADFKHVRVDFYLLDDGTIKFGEMTFTSASGFCPWSHPEWDLKFGELFDIGQ